MTDTEIRIACLGYAIETNAQKEGWIVRAPRLVEWVNGDPIRLECVRLACKSSGIIAKTTDLLLAHAEAFLKFVVPERPTEPKPKWIGGSTSTETKKKASRKKES